MSRGYNAIELQAITHDHARANHPPFDGSGNPPFLNRLNGANWDGSLKYSNITSDAPDMTTPNEAYWLQIDSLVSYCERNGMLMLLFPAYLGYNGGAEG